MSHAEHSHEHECCSACCLPTVLALLGLVFFLLKWFLGIEDMEAVKRIFANLRSRNGQHWVSNPCSKYVHSCFNQRVIGGVQVDEKSKKNGGELVAAVLKSIFTLCGGHISPILVGCEQLGIKVVDTRHEVNAVFAADAVARLTQRIGVVAVTAGPGLTNTITAVKNAQMAESPLLLIGGAAPSLLKGRGALQDIDQGVLFRPLCKFTARVTKVRDIVPTVRRAIKEAQSGTPGPVFVEFPIDVLYPYEIIVKEMGFAPNPKGFKRFLNAYLFAYVSRQLGCAWIERDITPLPVEIPQPSEAEIDAAVELIAAAKKPLLLLGSQTVLPPVSPTDLQAAVNKLGIAAYLGGMCRGLLGHRLARPTAAEPKGRVEGGGRTVCDFRLGYGKALSGRAKVISINRNAEQMRKNEGFFWKSTLNIQKDVASTLLGIQRALEARKWTPPADFLASLKERERAKEESNAKKATEQLMGGKLNPLDLLNRLEKVRFLLFLFASSNARSRSFRKTRSSWPTAATFVGSAAYIVRPRGPLQWLDPGAFGTLGVGGGFALGAKTVFPNRPVVILYGDGYSLIEFDTFVRHKLPVIALIGNDACWSQIARDQVPWFNSAVGCELAHTAYEKVGEALGARGVLLSGEQRGRHRRRTARGDRPLPEGRIDGHQRDHRNHGLPRGQH
ncbi:2-hydroxyacyl-CoA lyase 2 [Aphelenchoides fujianensis]|nr:2-hydroxyacyl-CoA lyase 2 [Aphelenchoides fujianensis]